jgi:ribosome maturation factor RimP
MTASSQVDGVRSLAGPAAASAGLVLESVTVTPAGRRRVLRVVVDLPDDATGGVPMEAVAAASQALSSALDTSSVMGGAPYVLEVSSPGIDRPLTEPRHWRRSIGRLVRTTLPDGRELAGRLIEVDDDGVLIEATRVGWDELGKGRIEVEFSRPGEVELVDLPEDDDEDDDTDDQDDTDDTDETQEV